MLRPCPSGKVKSDDHDEMITIGQLARYAGISVKTVRFYHERGLLPEPRRDASGYRRYTAQQVVDLIRVRTLARAGVPLARIRELEAAAEPERAEALRGIDHDLSLRIAGLQETQRSLRRLAAGDVALLPAEVTEHLRALPGLGFSRRWVRLESDLWVLVFATHPDTAVELFRDQTEALAVPALRELYLDYDRAHDLDPSDPRLEDLAQRLVSASRTRYTDGRPPGQDVDSDIAALAQSQVNASSPAWRRLDHLVREQLGL